MAIFAKGRLFEEKSRRSRIRPASALKSRTLAAVSTGELPR